MEAKPLPPWATTFCSALVECGVFSADAPPNHILLNEYQPGQGLDAHKDGPLYAPRVAILSLGVPASFAFEDADRSVACSLELAPRSLLVFAGRAYNELLHRVLPVTAGRRLSLTVRRVVHVSDRAAPVVPRPLWEERYALARWLDGNDAAGK